MIGFFRFFAIFLTLLAAAKQGIAKDVDETAKCAATFRVLTSIEILDPSLGQ
jgi:hypothetical protein